jgi:hypothetical protein
MQHWWMIIQGALGLASAIISLTTAVVSKRASRTSNPTHQLPSGQ